MSEYIPPELRGKTLVDTIKVGSNHRKEDSIVFQFFVKTGDDLLTVAKSLARDETTGKWIGVSPPTSLFKDAMADVDRIDVYGKNEGVVYVHSPIINIDLSSDTLYQFLMLAVGGPVLEFVYYEKVSLLDFELPDALLKTFQGPRFGIEGMRRRIGLNEDEPVIMIRNSVMVLLYSLAHIYSTILMDPKQEPVQCIKRLKLTMKRG